MCGIVGYVGPRQATDILLEGLASLEYRGYDSAGVAVHDSGSIGVARRIGKLVNVRSAVADSPLVGTTGIGHTRWATHGRPTELNAHPHVDCTGKIAVVHNGIIENFTHLREQLTAAGHTFTSETDTEAVAHLIESHYDGDLTKAVCATLEELEGSYALCVLHSDEPETIIAVRKDSPLIVGLGDGENIVASDIPAVLRHTRDVLVVEDGEVLVVKADSVEIVTGPRAGTHPEPMRITWDVDAAEKGGFEDFMLKEIHEQPRAVRETLRGRITDDGEVHLSELAMSPEQVADIDRVFIIACGTSYHAGLIGKKLIEMWARTPVEVQVSSEFRYGAPIIDERTLVVAMTQSGETTDTLMGLREARARGAKVVAICNVVGSSIAREADGVIYTHAGPEIGVAATKTFTAQIAAVYVLALYLAKMTDRIDAAFVLQVRDELALVPDMIETMLGAETLEAIEVCARALIDAPSSLFLGRGIGVPIAMEGALKLKEISYMHAEAYPAGEMKHGPIALISEGMPIVFVATAGNTHEKIVSNIQEVRARGALVVAVASDGDDQVHRYAEHVLYVPRTSELLSAIPTAVPLQLLAYFVAKLRGCDVDQPRNLAKSVTVE